MSQYIVSARKYRPATFSSVVGQPALTRTLKNAVGSERVAQAYLFCGPRGVGKTSCARIFAKTINCSNLTADGEACGTCESCRAFAEQRSYNIIELDAASNNSVADIRALTEQVNIPPQTGRYRVFIIDEVHMLSSAAFNAFLKTLEEPPSYVVFILATTEKQKVLPTILSRCQIYDFNRISATDTVAHLKSVAEAEGITADPRALDIIARKADGAMRDALSIFDQVAASSMGNITYESAIASLNVLDYDYYFRLFDAFRNGDVAEVLMIYKDVRDHGFDSHFFLAGIAQHVRDLMVAASERTVALLEVGPETGARYIEQSKSMPVDWYYRAMHLLNDADLAYRTATNKQLHVELTLIRLCNTTTEPPKDAPTPDTVSAQKSTPTSSSESQPSVTPQPAAPAKPAAAPRMRPTNAPRRPQTLRLDGDKVAPAPPTAAPTATSQPHKEERSTDAPFTAEAFNEAWQRFANENKHKHILVSAMLGRSPAHTGSNHYKLLVDNPAQLEALHSELQDINTYLRKALGSSSLTLNVELAPVSERRKVKTPQEMLRDMVERNPDLGRILKEWNAEMA